MKSITFICFLLATGLASCSSTEFEIKESEVPPNVLTAFKAKYPTAQVKKWQAEKEDGKFVFEVLEEIVPRDDPNYNYAADLEFLEGVWIEKLQPYDDRGYNERKRSREERLRLIAANRNQ